MKTLCCIAATAALLISAPAMARDLTITGNTNIWSSAQGTSNSYGNANGFSTSSSGSMATAAPGLSGFSALTAAITTSNASAASNGNGYAQTQTSGYAGGSVSAYRGH